MNEEEAMEEARALLANSPWGLPKCPACEGAIPLDGALPNQTDIGKWERTYDCPSCGVGLFEDADGEITLRGQP